MAGEILSGYAGLGMGQTMYTIPPVVGHLVAAAPDGGSLAIPPAVNVHDIWNSDMFVPDGTCPARELFRYGEAGFIDISTWRDRDWTGPLKSLAAKQEAAKLAKRWKSSYTDATCSVERLKERKPFWALVDRAVKMGISRDKFRVYALLEGAERRLEELAPLKDGLARRDPSVVEAEIQEMEQLKKEFFKIKMAGDYFYKYMWLLSNFPQIQSMIERIAAYAPSEVAGAIRQLCLDHADEFQSVVGRIKELLIESESTKKFDDVTRKSYDRFCELLEFLTDVRDARGLDASNLDELVQMLQHRHLDDRRYLIRRMEDGNTAALLFGATHFSMLKLLTLRYSRETWMTYVDTNKDDRAGGFMHFAGEGIFRIDAGSSGVPTNLPTAITLWIEALAQSGYPADRIVE